MIDNGLLLIIDAQYDFCDEKGSLYVPGAEKDMERLASFIKNSENKFRDIVLSQDNHQVIDISHPAFWTDKNGENPAPFTHITVEDVENGVWTPFFGKESGLKYLKELDKQGEFPHVIWPEHCIEGSKGAAIVDVVMEAVKDWTRPRNKSHEVIQKGKNPFTEHFGIMEANVPLDYERDTQLNLPLLDSFTDYDTIYIAGEAQSHCVANTVKQLLVYPGIANKIIILKNCMSPVPGFEHLADDIYSQLKSKQFAEV
ncbi:MAG: isochorismatase family protein [Prevotellaceae bacterium]|jgi:nicotinamidase-related amidase|nr:isochorismatase family protein [Prevotellaceae bacterium]